MNHKETFTTTDGVTLQNYFDARLKSLEEKIDLQFRLTQIALDKAEVKTEVRLTHMNEFRESLKDQAANFITRTEADLVTVARVARIDALALALAEKTEALAKAVNEKSEGVKATLETKIDAQGKLVNMAVGMAILLAFVIPILLKFAVR